MADLWGDPLQDKSILSKSEDKAIIEKLKNESPKKRNENSQIIQKLEDIKKQVYRILGKYRYNTEVITTKERLHEYIDTAIQNGVIAVDTETNNTLDIIGGKIMGGCLYTPGMKQAYVPINHVDVYTRVKLPNQITEEQFGEEMRRLCNGTKLIYHNAKFDISIINNTCGVRLPYYWDTLIAARLLNENEDANLKFQYQTHIDNTQEKYSITKLFENMEYAIFEPELFALYAATDSFMTYKLYEYQLAEMSKPENKGVYNLFFDVEMPVLEVVTDMELSGIELDLQYHKRLQEKYHIILNDMKNSLDEDINQLKPKID